MLDVVLDAAIISRGCVQQANRDAVKDFVRLNQKYLTGRVLDFGCGKQPYRDYVKGEYAPYDPNYPDCGTFPAGRFDAILCTQAVQTLNNPVVTIEALRKVLNPGGHWVFTYNANWYELQPEDRWRMSASGMEYLLRSEIIIHEPIVTLQFNGWSMNLTYGIVAKCQ